MAITRVYCRQTVRRYRARLAYGSWLLGLCLVAMAAENNSPSALPDPPLISWSAGPYSLEQIVAHCRTQVDGAELRLALEIDDSQRRHLPAFSGTWWEAVLAIAAAWELRCDMVDPDREEPGRRPPGRLLVFPEETLPQHGAQVRIRSLPQINHGPWALPVSRATPTLRPGPPISAAACGPLLLIFDDLRTIDVRQSLAADHHDRWLALSARVYQCPVTLPDMIVQAALIEPPKTPAHDTALSALLGIATDSSPDMVLPITTSDQAHVVLHAAVTATLSQSYQLSDMTLPPDDHIKKDSPPWNLTWFWNASGANNGLEHLGFGIPSTNIGLAISPAPSRQPRVTVHSDNRHIPVQMIRVRSIKNRDIDVMQCTIRLPPAVTDAAPLTISISIPGPTREVPLVLDASLELP